MIPDLVNGLFELLGGVLLWQNVIRIRKDKQTRGINWQVTMFFALWGVWNLYYYPHLKQWLSFTGGLNIVVASLVWVWYAIKYRRN